MADYPISNVPRRVVYAASGTGPYAFTFEILSQTDIDVYKADVLLTLTTDYTVTINANGTGSVTLVATAGASNITIVGGRTVQRTTDFVTGGDFFANTLNDELDSQTIFIQQIAETAERGMKAPVTDPTDINMTLPSRTERAGKYLAFDEDGNPQPGDTAVEVAAVFAIKDEIEAVAAIDTEVVTVAGIDADVTTVAGIAANVTTVAGISADVTTVAGADADIATVAADLDGDDTIGTVAGVATEVAALGPIAADITAVAGDEVDIGVVAGQITPTNNISTVAGIAADVATVAGIAADVTTVAADGTDIGVVAGISANVTTVAGISANVTTVAGISADVTAVAADATDIGTVATNIANVNAVGAISANVTTVAGISADVTAVAGDATDIGTVATNIANVNTVAGISANVTTVAGLDTEIAALGARTVEIDALYAEIDDIATKVSKTSDTGSAVLPVGTTAQRDASPSAGFLRFNADLDEFEGYNGTAWSSVGGSAITNDTATSTDVFPLFADATTGTAANVYTSDAKLLYKPSTGEFKSQQLVATNGIVVNSATVSADYTIPTGNNAMSAGPVTVDDGITVTISDGSNWVVV
jgi:hypothetical protein